VNAVIDRPSAAGPAPATALPQQPGRRQGYRGFHEALNSRCELALAEHLAIPAGGPAWERATDALALAGRIVAVHGMPARHAAARQQLAAFLGVYDRFFRLPRSWELDPMAPLESPLTWRTAAGHVLVDVVRTAPPSHPLADTGTFTRLSEAVAWAETRGLRLAGVRLLALSAPATSLLHNPATGLLPLADTEFAGALAAPAGVAA
jgi:hypothetical protein